MTDKSDLIARLGIAHGIIQAPMAGGASTPALVAAVAEAGAIGFFGHAYSTPEQIAEDCRAVRARTDRPFGINLFVSLPAPAAPDDAERAVASLDRYYAALGVAPPDFPPPSPIDFEAQFAAVLEGGAAAFSFTFGIVSAAALRAAKDRGMVVIGTATTVDEARALEAAGVDAVVVQGSEAGAHRGTFDRPFEESLIGTMALVPQAVDAVAVPVIASGGIMDGRGIAAARALGAAAVQMGTAFLTSDEAGIPDVYKQAILDARESDTRVTRAFSGRPARGIANRFMDEVEGADRRGAILPYPIQNAMTRPIRAAAAEQGRPEFLSLWAGQGLGLARREPAGRLVARLVEETRAAVKTLDVV